MPKREYREQVGTNLAPLVRAADRWTPGCLPLRDLAGSARDWYVTRYYKSPALNAVRRRRDRLLGYVASRVLWDNAPTLHVGCGPIKLPGAINLDYLKSEATDYVLEAGSLPFPDDSVDRIETYHMIEHLPADACAPILREWRRVLRPGGTLVVEVPDFDGVVEEYVSTTDRDRRERLLEYVFGDQRDQGNVHYWGWNAERLGDIIAEAGFTDVRDEPAEDFHADEAPCLRMEARCPGEPPGEGT